jgi:hypothetical protein
LVGCTSQQPDGFLPLRAFKPSSSESADSVRSIIQVIFDEGTESADIATNENILLLDEYSKVKLF